MRHVVYPAQEPPSSTKNNEITHFRRFKRRNSVDIPIAITYWEESSSYKYVYAIFKKEGEDDNAYLSVMNENLEEKRFFEIERDGYGYGFRDNFIP